MKKPQLFLLLLSLFSFNITAQQKTYSYNRLNSYDILKYYLNNYGALQQNVQTTNWSNFNVPFQIRAQALFIYNEDDVEHQKQVPANIPKWKLSRFYFAGEFVTLEAFDKYSPLRSTHGESQEKPVNYLEDNFIYFKIYDKNNLEVTNASYAIPYGKNASKEAKNKIQQETGAILDTSLKVNDYLLVNFYRKKADTLIASFYIKRIKMGPEVKQWFAIAESSPEQKLNLSKNGEVGIHANERLVLVFDKSKFKRDSIVQYQLLDAKLTDTAWYTTSHFLTLPYLKNKSTYTLNLRYNFQKESIVSYRISVKPLWHQTPTFYLMLFIVSTLILILVIVLIAKYRIRLAQRKQNQIQQQIHSIQNQLNPHFTFNALSSIQGLINTNKVNEANNYLSEFSVLLRSTLANSHLIYVPLNKELQLLKTYLKLEQLRFGFTYKFIVSESISQNDVDIPNFLLQPIIENAVKHGVSTLEKDGFIQIHLEKANTNLVITISDNGRGFEENSKRSGYGIQFIKEKIKLLNTLLKYEAIQLTFSNRNGAVVHISFNNWLS